MSGGWWMKVVKNLKLISFGIGLHAFVVLNLLSVPSFGDRRASFSNYVFKPTDAFATQRVVSSDNKQGRNSTPELEALWKKMQEELPQISYLKSQYHSTWNHSGNIPGSLALGLNYMGIEGSTEAYQNLQKLRPERIDIDIETSRVDFGTKYLPSVDYIQAIKARLLGRLESRVSTYEFAAQQLSEIASANSRGIITGLAQCTMYSHERAAIFEAGAFGEETQIQLLREALSLTDETISAKFNFTPYPQLKGLSKEQIIASLMRLETLAGNLVETIEELLFERAVPSHLKGQDLRAFIDTLSLEQIAPIYDNVDANLMAVKNELLSTRTVNPTSSALIDRYFMNAKAKIARSLQSQRVEVRTPVSTISLREAPPAYALVRGFVSKNCSTDRSSIYSLLPLTRLWYIFSSNQPDTILGYVDMTYATSRSRNEDLDDPNLQFEQAYIADFHAPGLSSQESQKVVLALASVSKELRAKNVAVNSNVNSNHFTGGTWNGLDVWLARNFRSATSYLYDTALRARVAGWVGAAQYDTAFNGAYLISELSLPATESVTVHRPDRQSIVENKQANEKLVAKDGQTPPAKKKTHDWLTIRNELISTSNTRKFAALADVLKPNSNRTVASLDAQLTEALAKFDIPYNADFKRDRDNILLLAPALLTASDNLAQDTVDTRRRWKAFEAMVPLMSHPAEIEYFITQAASQPSSFQAFTGYLSEMHGVRANDPQFIAIAFSAGPEEIRSFIISDVKLLSLLIIGFHHIKLDARMTASEYRSLVKRIMPSLRASFKPNDLPDPLLKKLAERLNNSTNLEENAYPVVSG